jgi:hypothetical protein
MVRVIVWTLVALVALGGAARMLTEAGRPGADPVRVVDVGMWGLLAVLFGCVGALIVSRRAANRVGWLLLVPAIGGGATAFGETYLERLAEAPSSVGPLLFAALLLDVAGWALAIFPVLLLAQVFPTGRPLPGRWRIVTATTVTMAAVFLFYAVFMREFTPVSLERSLSVPNPVGFLAANDFPTTAWLVLLVGVSLGSAASLVTRYRAGSPIERVQLRWLLFACATFVGVNVTLIVVDLRVADIQLSLAHVITLPLALALIPLAIAVAIFRYRLWDIDIVIRRTLVYAPLTAIMTGVFSVAVGMTQQVVGSWEGGRSEVTSALTTIIVLATFDYVKRMLTRLVDARFKEVPDALQRWHAYGASLQTFLDVHDPAALGRRLLQEAVAAVGARGGRVVVEGAAEHAQGAHAAAALEIPLEHRGDLMGRLQLAARWNGRPYDADDHALLRVHADTVARMMWLARKAAPATMAAPAASVSEAAGDGRG